jgi:hypothetical protein
MDQSPARITGLPRDWADVLDRVQQALTQVLKETIERERALQTPPPTDAAAERVEVGQQHLTQLDEHLCGLQACAGKAAENAAQTEAALAAAEEALKRWLTDQQTRRGEPT